MYVLCYPVEIYGKENVIITRTASVTDTIQSTCYINFTTVNTHSTTSTITMITPAPDQSVSATSGVTTEFMTTDSTTTDSAMTDSAMTDSVPIAVIAASITGGILGLSICTVALIVIRNKRKNKIRRNTFIMQSFTSLFSEYVIFYKQYVYY